MDWGRIGLLVAAALTASVPAPAAGEPVVEPIDIGFTERTGRSLLFLDVEAVDGDGRPLTGLGKDDFKIRVNYLWRTIYSVDDLCPCGEATAADATVPPDPARTALARTPPHFVLYFDFSQLQEAGRVQALEEATRWASAVIRPEDRVMVVAYSSVPGLRRLCDFTGDRDEVLRAIDVAASDPALVDPFPAEQGRRQQQCDDGTVSCYYVGRQEFFHARRSLETLRNFLTELDEVAPRKTMLLFHENAVIFPGHLYADGASYLPQTVWDRLDALREPGFARARDFRAASALVPDLLELSQEVGGAATASRTVVFPLACGSARTWTVNLGANLADGTGGDYNRTPNELTGLLAEAGRGCACTYRIGLEMDDARRSFVLRTKVKVRGRSLPARYQVEYLTEADRWMRKAQLVLANPESWREIQIGAAVVPVRARKSGWDARVEIGVDLAALAVGLGDDDLRAVEWEVAALLSDADGERHWEMLGVYRASPGGDDRIDTWVLHSRPFADLPPGRYELRAFVHDRTADLWGAGVAEIELPAPSSRAFAGPVAQRPETAHLDEPLPLRDKKATRGAKTAASPGVAPLPFGGGSLVLRGEPVRFLTFVCGAGVVDLLPRVKREADGRSFEGVEEAVRSEAGDCTRVVHAIDTSGLDPGRYAFELTAGGGDPTASTSIEIVPAALPSRPD